jgi:hypothetical protein
LLGRREWLIEIKTRLSMVSGLGGHYVAPRAARAIMNVFRTLDPDQRHNRTWRDVLDVSVDTGLHLSKNDGTAPLFLLDTPASAITALLPFPIEYLSMFICIQAEPDKNQL